MPRPVDPRRIRFGGGKYEADPDWNLIGSLIFQPSTGKHVGWVNGKAQTGWQVFHTNGHPLGAVLLSGQVTDYRGTELGRVPTEPSDEQVLAGVAQILDATLDRFE